MFYFLFIIRLPWVPETFLARFPISVKLVASAFGKHRKFTPHARKTSGAQGIIRRTGVIKVKTEGDLLTASARGRGEGKIK